jgi:hypothetical protein
MLTRGVSDIRGMRGLNTRPGLISESAGFLRLYQLAAEKNHLMKKLAWVKRQKDQTERRLSEIAHAIHSFEKMAETEPASNTDAGFRSTLITY